MIQKANYKISLEEHKLIGKKIIARQPEISFAEALKQTRRLKRISRGQSKIKKEQRESLTFFANDRNLWIDHPPQSSRFLTQGGEAEIYFLADHKHVIKLNDAVYYATWLDFFNSILIHNLLFEETYYQLEGFLKI